MKNYSKEFFLSQLELLDWSSALEKTDVNEAWCTFSNVFKNAIDEIAPLQEVRLKQRNQLWFTGAVQNMICRGNQALSKFRQTKHNDDCLEFKEYILKEKFSRSRLCPEQTRGKPKLFQKAMV